MGKRQRDSNIELLRIVAMFLIVLHHCAYHGFREQGLYTHFLDVFQFGGGVGVNIFVLITGYFMVSHTPTLRKLFRLYAQVLSFSVGGYILYRACLGNHMSNGLYANISYLLPVLSVKYWFISVYFFLLLISPWLNVLIVHVSRISMLKLVMLMIVFCSLSSTLPIAGWGMGNFALFMMLYLIGAYIRLYVDRASISPRLMSLCFITLMVFLQSGIGCCNLWHLNIIKSMLVSKTGIVYLLLSVSLFMAFLGCAPKHSAAINIISSCTLGVYLLHEHPLLRSCIWHECLPLQNAAPGAVSILYACAAALIVYIACTAVALLYQFTLGKIYISCIEARLVPFAEGVWTQFFHCMADTVTRFTKKEN